MNSFLFKIAGNRIAHLSCVHIGNSSCHYGCMEAFQKRIKRNKITFISYGDGIEAITPDDKRFDISHFSGDNESNPLTMSVMAQIDAYIDFINPIRKLCLGVMNGNHEAKRGRIVGNIAMSIASRLNVNYLHNPARATVRHRDGEYSLFMAHPRWSSNIRAGMPEQRKANEIAALKRKLMSFRAHLRVIGHLHKTIVGTPSTVTALDLTESLHFDRKTPYDADWYITLPSMFMSYGQNENYAQESLYDPNEVGWIETIQQSGRVIATELRGDKGQILDIWENK